MAEIARDVQAELRASGLNRKVTAQVVRKIERAGRRAQGVYRLGQGGIGVRADSASGPIGTLRHEIIHAPRDGALWGREYGLFIKAEWQGLETAFTMQPVRETLVDTDAQAVARLEYAWAHGRLPWVSRPYWRHDDTGRAWFGRGYVQLTHRDNYTRAGHEIGIDLLTSPARALEPEIAVQIFVRGCAEGWFTGKALRDYLPGDYVNARRVVNVGRNARGMARWWHHDCIAQRQA